MTVHDLQVLDEDLPEQAQPESRADRSDTGIGPAGAPLTKPPSHRSATHCRDGRYLDNLLLHVTNGAPADLTEALMGRPGQGDQGARLAARLRRRDPRGVRRLHRPGKRPPHS